MSAIRYRRAPDVEELPLRKRVGLYRTGAEQALILNPVGSLLWQQLEEPQTHEELVAHLATVFPAIDRVRLQQDVTNYLESMQQRGIIIRVTD